MIRRLYIFFILVPVAMAMCAQTAPTVPILTAGPTFFAVSGKMPVLTLNGQTNCDFGMSGATGATITPFGSSNGGASYFALTGTGFGAQTTNADFGGLLNNGTNPPVLTNFYVQVTIASGSALVWQACGSGIAAAGGGGGGGNVTIVAPTDGSGNVKVNCITGCSATATIPPELSTTSPLPVSTSLPVIAQHYWWNGVGWIAQSATSPAPVTTPAPCATPSCNSVVWQGTSPWVVNTVAPFNAPAATASPNGAPTPLTLLPVAPCAPTATVMSCQTITAGVASVTTPAPVGTIGVVLQAACAVAYPCGFPTPIPFPWPTSATTLNLNVSVCSPSVAAQCAGVNGNNQFSIDCVAAQYPCGFPTPVPTVAPVVLPTASPGGALTQYTPTQAFINCASTQSTGTSMTAITGHVVECEKHGVLANGLCTSTLACVPAQGDTAFSCAITTTLTQCIAAPGAGSIHITAIQVAADETATGGGVEGEHGTGANCVTGTTPDLLLLTMPAAIALSGYGYGTGVGSIYIVPALNAWCVFATAGTVSIGRVTGTYTVY